MGVLLGTPAYMAPEQAQGRPVDRRVDIWAFGCVLYEMLAGRRAFGGETITETLAAVLRDQVDWSALPPSVHPAIRRVIKRCLERNPAQRFHDIADVRIELSDLDEPAPAVPAAPPARVGRADGRVLAYRGRDSDGIDRLFVRQLDTLLPAPVPGTEGARLPFFSPDGQWLGFFAGGFLKKVAVSGGAPQTIAPASSPLGGSWMDDGSIVFVADVTSGLQQVPSAGGTPETLMAIDSRHGTDTVAAPWALPGGRGVLLTVRGDNRFDLAVLSLRDRTLQVLAEDAYSPVLAGTGHILFHQGNSILALPFDSERLTVAGSAFPVLSDLGTRLSFQTRLFAVARNGTLVYVPASGRAGASRMLWVDRQGQATAITTLDRPADTPRLSPDGSRIAFRAPAPNCDVWVHDFSRGTTTRLTHEGDNHGVVWMDDGARIATARERREGIDIIAVSADGSGSTQRITTFPAATAAVPSAWGSGSLLVQRGGGRTGIDISVLSIAAPEPRPLVSSPFEESGGVVSSDGRYLAYVSNESGRAEVYVQHLGSQGPRVQVSTAGGIEPVWAPNGKELFFRSGRDLLAVPIETTPQFAIGRPQALFSGDYAFGALAATVSGLANYDVAPDGQRFVMMTGTQWLEGQLVVVLNWFADWKKLGSGAGP
jgi:serine/threonine-protein kinase